MTPSPGEITVLLKRWDADPRTALQELTPIVYQELRRIAVAYLRRERPDHTLQPTALINEAWLRLVRQDSMDLQDRAHFYALAARMMRQILVDSARAQQSAKRGSGGKLQLDERIDVGGGFEPAAFIDLNDALERLEGRNARAVQCIELKHFGGLTLEEIAGSLSVSLATVKRDLMLGEAWLRRALAGA